MARDTKNRIIETALALFSQSGYLATSMNDIAQQVGLTKAALYKHFSGKQEILDCIVAQMERMDLERAQEYEMPETEPDASRKPISIFRLNRSTHTASRSFAIGPRKSSRRVSAGC